MRPKKIILCVDDSEQELSVLKGRLATNGYRALAATNAQEAIGILTSLPVDLALVGFTVQPSHGKPLVERIKRMAVHVPVILLGDPVAHGAEIHAADAFLARKSCSAQQLLERVKVMSARKRGPRKGSQRVMVAELAAAS
jgi:two-component system, OmpR family, response regulator CpxR